MKTKEIRELSAEEIEQRIEEESRDLSRLTFQQAISGLESPIVLRYKRRDIARMKTILNQKQVQG